MRTIGHGWGTGSLLVCLVFAAVTIIGCSPAARQRAATIATAAASGAAGASSSQYSYKLMIFGGLDHKSYLGCLNCNEYVSDSVFNSYGSYGSPYSSQSIWNQYTQFGSAYSTYSVCNPNALDPPVIVDQDGKYYGRLTANHYHPQLGIGAKYVAWLTETVCK
jgi:hypothetical protein